MKGKKAPIGHTLLTKESDRSALADDMFYDTQKGRLKSTLRKHLIFAKMLLNLY